MRSPCQEAAALVSEAQERQNTYGEPYQNHLRIARLWNARLHEKLSSPLEPEDVASCMRMVKEARLVQTPGHYDSIMDIAGYAEVEYLIGEGRDGSKRKA